MKRPLIKPAIVVQPNQKKKTSTSLKKCSLAINIFTATFTLLGMSSATGLDIDTVVNEKCAKIALANEKSLHKAGQITARNMRDTYKEAERIATELVEIDNKVRKNAQEIDNILTKLPKEANKDSIRAQNLEYQVRYWRTKLNEVRKKVRPLQNRLDSFANPFGHEQADLKTQIAKLKAEQTKYEKKFSEASKRLNNLITKTQDIHRFIDNNPNMKNYLTNRKKDFEEAKAEHQQKLKELEDAKAKAAAALLLHDGLKTCIDKRRAELKKNQDSESTGVLPAPPQVITGKWGMKCEDVDNRGSKYTKIKMNGNFKLSVGATGETFGHWREEDGETGGIHGYVRDNQINWTFLYDGDGFIVRGDLKVGSGTVASEANGGFFDGCAGSWVKD